MRGLIFHLLLLSAALITIGCDRCNQVQCSNGICEEGSCVCEDGYYGKLCEKEHLCFTRVIDCGENGACLNGRCQCEEGFSGQYCEEEDRCITEAPDCKNGGVCVEGICDCPDLYVGEFCQTYDECAPVDCKYSQPCENGKCLCNDFTSGEFCEEKLIDKHIKRYEGWWTCQGEGLYLNREGTLDVKGSSNEKALNGEAYGSTQEHTLTMRFDPTNLNFFLVIAADNQELDDGFGQFNGQGSVSLEYTFERFNGGDCTCTFTSE